MRLRLVKVLTITPRGATKTQKEKTRQTHPRINNRTRVVLAITAVKKTITPKPKTLNSKSCLIAEIYIILVHVKLVYIFIYDLTNNKTI